MRVLACALAVLVLVVWLVSGSEALSKAKACRRGCGAAIQACVEGGGKRARCKRRTLKLCRKRGLETCVATTTMTMPEPVPTTVPPSTLVPTTTTTTLPSLNGCTTADAVVREKPTDDRTVEFGSYFYAPRCLRIAAGQSVTFAAVGSATFDSHPLVGGEVVGDAQVPDPGSPIGVVSGDTIADVQFPSAGTFPYYCEAHGALLGMTGVVFVDPASP